MEIRRGEPHPPRRCCGAPSARQIVGRCPAQQHRSEFWVGVRVGGGGTIALEHRPQRKAARVVRGEANLLGAEVRRCVVKIGVQHQYSYQRPPMTLANGVGLGRGQYSSTDLSAPIALYPDQSGRRSSQGNCSSSNTTPYNIHQQQSITFIHNEQVVSRMKMDWQHGTGQSGCLGETQQCNYVRYRSFALSLTVLLSAVTPIVECAD